LADTAFNKLIEIMATLRSDKGCPWDKVQTHESLKPFLLEEAYEVLEALDRHDFNDLKEELGDLLLQIVFHAQLAHEADLFTIEDVLKTINDKLIRRHPHVFGQANVNSEEEQCINWERIKKKEGKKSVLNGVPKTMPALSCAYRIQQRASTVGFDWKNKEQVWNKVIEEMDELRIAENSQDQQAIIEELGDLLFALVNYSRFMKVNPEESLRRATEKFIKRFNKVENCIKSQGKKLQDTSLEEMDAVWNRIKKE
jgi:MazG family protein